MLHLVADNDLPNERLRKLREELKLSLRDVVKLSENSISHGHISHLERDPAAWKKLGNEKMGALARAYSKTVAELIAYVNNTPYPPKPNIYNDQATMMNPNLRYGTKKIPKYDWVGLGPGGRDALIIDYVDIPETWSGDFVSYDARGDSMLPDIPDGTELIIRLQDHADFNEVVLCYAPEEGTLLKVLGGLTEDGTYILSSFNTTYGPILTKELKIYGVLWQTRTAWKANGRRR